MRTLKIKIYRINPLDPNDKPYYDEYIVEEKPRMSVLLMLQEIQETKDQSIYYNSFCRSSICGSCAIKISGQPKLACKTQIASLPQEITLEPLDLFPIIKDLATDKHIFFEKLNEKLEAWVHREKEFNPEAEDLMSDETASKIYEADRCIECGICISACAAKHCPEFIGATGSNKGLRFLLDPRNEKEEAIDILIENLASDKGLWGCHGIGACENFCPKEIPLVKQMACARKKILALVVKEWIKKFWKREKK